MKNPITNLLWGVAITGAVMFMPYQYCMDGPGRGFPFAVYCPSCGAAIPVFAFDDSKIPQILDLGGFIGDVLIWGSLVALLRALVLRRRAILRTPSGAAKIECRG